MKNITLSYFLFLLIPSSFAKEKSLPNGFYLEEGLLLPAIYRLKSVSNNTYESNSRKLASPYFGFGYTSKKSKVQLNVSHTSELFRLNENVFYPFLYDSFVGALSFQKRMEYIELTTLYSYRILEKKNFSIEIGAGAGMSLLIGGRNDFKGMYPKTTSSIVLLPNPKLFNRTIPLILLQLSTAYRLQKLLLSLTAQLSYRLLTEPIELNKKSKEGKVSVFEDKFLNIGAGVRYHLQ